MFLVIFFSIFFQIVARPSKESGFLTFDDAPGQKFTSEEVETIMEFAQRRIAEQLALAATGQNDPSLMESLVRLKEEIVMDKQVPKSIPPVRHLDAVEGEPARPQVSGSAWRAPFHSSLSPQAGRGGIGISPVA